MNAHELLARYGMTVPRGLPEEVWTMEITTNNNLQQCFQLIRPELPERPGNPETVYSFEDDYCVETIIHRTPDQYEKRLNEWQKALEMALKAQAEWDRTGGMFWVRGGHVEHRIEAEWEDDAGKKARSEWFGDGQHWRTVAWTDAVEP